MTASSCSPPRPKLYCWKLPASSVKPYLFQKRIALPLSLDQDGLPVEQVMRHVAGIEKLCDSGVDVLLRLGHLGIVVVHR